MLKKTFLLIATSIAIVSCGGHTEQEKASDTTKSESPVPAMEKSDSSSSSAIVSIATSTDKGAQLIIQNDCRNCHREREKLIGPSFTSIANKYTAKDIDQLADKVIKGTSGSWGDAAMSPHPSLQQNDAKEIIAFILKMKQ
jgi:cytochrome c